MSALDFFYDIGSPYSYLCATQIRGVADKHERAVTWRPMLLGAVFKASGNDMPARVPAKAQWMLKDLQLWAKHYGVQFQFPPLFPANTVRAMRACVAAQARGKVEAMSVSLFQAYWVRGLDPSGEEAIGQASAAAGLDGAEILKAIDEQATKDALRKNTDEAVARGVFGAPTIFVGDAMFWGNDRLELVDRYLAGEIR